MKIMPKNAELIVVDIDAAELDKPTIDPKLKINADLKQFMPELLNSLDNDSLNVSQKWLDWCVNIKRKYAYLKNSNDSKVISAYDFANVLSTKLPEEACVVMSNGSACVCPYQVAVIKSGQRYILNSGNASMGYGLPSAIGASIAKPGKEIICLEGDGSIMMNLQELQTVKHYSLPIKIFIINNDGYISIKQTQKNFFDGRMTGAGRDSGVSCPDFVKVAESFGLKSIVIDNNNDVIEKIEDVLSFQEAVVCDVRVNSEYIFSPKLSAKKLADGTMVSPSLEDMYPFLSKEEFEENIFDKI